MKRVAFFVAAVAASGIGCNGNGLDSGGPSPTMDKGVVFPDVDGMPDGAEETNLCGKADPGCQWGAGSGTDRPFALPTDPQPDPAAAGDGVGRDPNGWLILDPTTAAIPPYLWLAQDSDGTVAKVDSRTMKEVARYRTTTCFSRPSGNKQQCDGQSGCCAADSAPQWLNRKNKMDEGPAQQVQLTNNSPSRTAVDLNGDLFVANRAFSGQASITKIANDPSACKDRNKNGRIDTSSDVNKNGRIDRNDPKEFLDLDDECILWTTNHGAAASTGRSLALGPGVQDDDPSDAFAGGYYTGRFYRMDGTTGKMKDEWQLPQGCGPYGVVVDAQGFGWAPNLGQGKLCYFDTRTSGAVGQARGTMDGYGVALDRDQNIWVGQSVARYTPDRRRGFASLGDGYWTYITLTGIGIAADSRDAKKYFVWSAGQNGLTRIPASAIPLPKGRDTSVDLDPNWPKINVNGYGIGVDAAQNVIAAPRANIVIRTRVDQNGDFMQPDVSSPPKNGELCPAGDKCDLASYQYTYSDFTGFSLRNFTRPTGLYAYIVKPNCLGWQARTRWLTVTWDAEVPASTSVTLHARSGPSATPDASWGQWTSDYKLSPADLSPPGVLVPNWPARNDADYLQIRFTLRTSDRTQTPKLKSFTVAYECYTP